ncbi:MAG TPA: HAMP domain-containing histidine kinase [Thermoplasmatales archaeon]|nr:HAMP domain-containing histidine kinase [Thermoplasmatales archaeon]
MDEKRKFEIIEEIPLEDDRVKELEEKLKETEKKLNELNRSLEQKVIERTIEIRKLLQHKIRFIDNLSHDLATPITPLISLLPLIKEDVNNEKTKELIETCIRNVEYIKRVINNTRELADISASDFMFNKEKLYDLVSEIIKKYDVVFKNQNIKVENKIQKDIFIKTEKDKFLKLIDHIISNAVNAMKNGGTLTVTSKPVKKEKQSFVQISISDTGVGLTREECDRIFNEFYKTDYSRHKLDSTGLGLAICKAIVEKHGGRIWADSHGKNTGTTISFTIPSGDVEIDRSF